MARGRKGTPVFGNQKVSIDKVMAPNAPSDEGKDVDRDEAEMSAVVREIALEEVLSFLNASIEPDGFGDCLDALPTELLSVMAVYGEHPGPGRKSVGEKQYNAAIEQMLGMGLRACAALAHAYRLWVSVRRLGHLNQRTKRLFREMERTFGNDEDPLVQWLYHEGLLRFADNHPRHRDAIATYDRLVSRCESKSCCDAELEQYYEALLQRGYLFGITGRSEKALADYRKVVSGCLHSEHFELRWRGARALTNIAVRLRRMGRHEEARKSLEPWVDGYVHDEANLDQFVYAVFLLASDAKRRARFEEVLRLCQEGVARIPASERGNPDIEARVLQLDYLRVLAHLHLNQFEEARVTEAQCWLHPDEGLDRESARAMGLARLRLAEAAFDRGLLEQAAALCETIVERFETGSSELTDWLDREPEYRLIWASGEASVLGCRAHEAMGQAERGRALLNAAPVPAQLTSFPHRSAVYREWQGIVWRKLGELDRAIERYEVLWQMRDSPRQDVRAEVAWAQVDAGTELARAGRYRDALPFCERVIDHFSEETSDDIRIECAWARSVKGECLLALGEKEAAKETWEGLVETVSDRDPPGGLRAAAISGRRLLAKLLVDSEGIDASLARLEELEKRYRRDRDFHVRQELAQIMGARAELLDRLGRRAEREKIDRKLITEYVDCADEDSLEVREVLAAARNRLGLSKP